jgi:hypothetical protein
LLFFSQMIEILCEKYKDISEQVDSRDPMVFVWVPSILILKSLDNEDKSICFEFNTQMFNVENEESGKIYTFIKSFKENLYNCVKDQYAAYNLLEKLVLFEENEEMIEDIAKYTDRSLINGFRKRLKILSMQLQRGRPQDWNHFINLAMNL